MNQLKYPIRIALFFLLTCFQVAVADTDLRLFPLTEDSDLVGSHYQVVLTKKVSPQTIARDHLLSVKALRQVNSTTDLKNINSGSTITIPNQFVLPSKEFRTGIVINIPEKRLYYFTPDQQSVYIFPVALGRPGWRTPLVQSTIVRKQLKPNWYVPKSIREYTLAKKNKLLPKVVKPGKNNPLGEAALYFQLRGYLIHGTNDPKSIGHLVTSGCVRMYNQDILQLHSLVETGTPVTIMHEPYKVAIDQGIIYLEAYAPVYKQSLAAYEDDIREQLDNQKAQIDWTMVKKIMHQATGVPTPIGVIEKKQFSLQTLFSSSDILDVVLGD